MGKASRLARRLKEKATELFARKPDPRVNRSLNFRTLIKTDRAVRVLSRKTHGRRYEMVYVVVQLAGEQNPDGSARLVSIGFTDGVSARKAAGSLLAVMRDGMNEGWVDTDDQYNELVRVWGDTALRKIKKMNRDLLTNAELRAKNADASDVLVDVRGMTLKDLLLAKLGLRKEKEKTQSQSEAQSQSEQEGDSDGNS